MPSKSDKQRRFMAAAANNPAFARKAGIKQSVAKEFHMADRKKKGYSVGGPAASIRAGIRGAQPVRPARPAPRPTPGGPIPGNARRAPGGALRSAGRPVGAPGRSPTPTRAANAPLASARAVSRGPGSAARAVRTPSPGALSAVGGSRLGRGPATAPTGRMGASGPDLGQTFGQLARLHRGYAEGGQVRATQMAGTNCANCLYASQPVEELSDDETNSQGGVKIKGAKNLKLAEKADLITLPGDGKPRTKFHCSHKDINQFVNERMCCIYWDAPGTYRQWQEESDDS